VDHGQQSGGFGYGDEGGGRPSITGSITGHFFFFFFFLLLLYKLID
jgi:hypothetical protein